MSVEQNDPDRWKKNSTRAAILQAARRIAAREGPEAVTLGRVAAEAGFAAPAVYAYFVSKDELHMALVADDLETLAEAVRAESGEDQAPVGEVIAFQRHGRIADDSAEAAAPQDQSPAEAAGPVSLAHIQEALGVFLDPNGAEQVDAMEPADRTPEAEPVAHEDQAAAPTSEAEVSVDASPDVPEPLSAEPVAAPRRVARTRAARARADQEQQERLPLAEPAEQEPGDPAAAIARLEEAVAQLQNRPVDAWLERRLRVFERTLADLEARMEACERNSTAAAAAWQEQTSEAPAGLAEAVGELQDREERHRAALSDYRLYLKDVAGRLGAVEAAVTRLSGAAAAPAEPYFEPEAAPPDEAREPERVSLARADYLEAARNAARDAARQPERTPRRHGWAGLSFSTRSLPRWALWAALGGLLLVMALIAARAYLAQPATQPPAAVARVLPPPASSADARVVQLAKAGNAQAETVAGLKLLNGDGTATDIPSAAFWLGKAAAQHQPVAEYWLGTLYERGRGVAKDKTAAMQWYAASAKAGNAKAMYRLGVGYAEGWSGKPDDAAAAKWFQAAANLGIVDAQFNLAVLYERGAGVPQSLTKAFTWYAIAAAQGDAESKARIDTLASRMSAADVKTAQDAAAKFQAQTPLPAANEEPTVAEVARLP